MKRWFDTIQARPAVVSGYAVMEETRKNRRPVDDKTRRCISARLRRRSARLRRNTREDERQDRGSLSVIFGRARSIMLWSPRFCATRWSKSSRPESWHPARDECFRRVGAVGPRSRPEVRDSMVGRRDSCVSAKRLVLIQGRDYRDCGDHLFDVSHYFGKVFDTGGAAHLEAAEEATVGR
jgi:hypothetical protein